MKLRSPGGVLNSFRIRYLRRHSQRHRLAGRAAGDVAGHVRRADQHQRERQQLQAVRFRAAPFAAGPSGHGALRADGQPGLSGRSSGPKLQETDAEAVGGQPADLARQHREVAGERRARSWRSRASRSSMCRRPSWTRCMREMLKVQDKAVADAHISPKLVEAGHGGCRRLTHVAGRAPAIARFSPSGTGSSGPSLVCSAPSRW